MSRTMIVRDFDFKELDMMIESMPDNLNPDLNDWLQELCIAIKETIRINFESRIA